MHSLRRVRCSRRSVSVVDLLKRWRSVSSVRGLTGPEKAVLSCLAFHAGAAEPVTANPAILTIAAETCFSETAVRKALHGLVAAGFVVPLSKSAGRYTNRYRLNLPEPPASRMVNPASREGLEPAEPYASRAATPREANPNIDRTENKPREVAPQDSIWSVWVGLGGRRASLGRLISTHGEEPVAKALAVAALKRPADVESYIRGVLGKHHKNGTDYAWSSPV